MGPYNVSKSAVVALSETLLAELRPEGIGVSVACPMFFRTNIITTARVAEGEEGQRLKELASELVDGAQVGPDEVARELVRGVDNGEFYLVPMAAGRWAWRLKRLSPEVFVKGGHLLHKRFLERLRGKPQGTPK